MRTKNNSHTRWLKRLAQAAIVLIAVAGLAVVVGMIYQQVAMEHDRARYVASNNIVNISDVQMHIQCEGTGSPTVVFESGAGTPYLNWWEVQDAIAQDVRTCVYDRQGIGWSEYRGNIPTPISVVDTLHTLLQRVGESGPYVLVGHSMGGIYVREYAAQYPDDVVGMVLIDSSHEQQQVHFPAEYAALSNTELPVLRLCRRIAPTGILRILNLGAQESVYEKDTPVYRENVAIFNQSHYCAGVSTDLAGIHSLDTTTPPSSLGAMPLVVLTAGVLPSKNPILASEEFSQETLQEVDRVWLELQAELAALSTNSSWTVVDGATHYIHLDQPDVVIDAIRNILERISIS